MKELIKKILALLFHAGRLLHRNKLIVLAYHDVRDVNCFESHLALISEYYNPVTIHQVEDYIVRGVALPPYAVLVTFDDGEPSVKYLGIPLLKKYKIPAVAFVVSENIRSKQKFWWRIVEESFMNRKRTHAEARKEIRRLKKVPNRERIRTLEQIESLYAGIYKDPLALSIADLYEMRDNGITIGSHTATHPILNQCSSDELDTEFSLSKDFFRSKAIETFHFFAYPNGDYSPAIIPFLKRYEVSLAFTFDHKINGTKIDQYAISRVRANSHDPIDEFKLRISGISTLFN
jgi:poly-beta-1,6-N-acetyl-D-glucosamine N-deacetylase